MRPESLFHFTKNIETLKAILSSGIFWPRFCMEDVTWIRSGVTTHVMFAMTCFCDIPLSRISAHTQTYGGYGIGLKKEWALEKGLNPVIYLNNNSPLKKCLRTLFRKADHIYDGVGPEAYLEAIELAAYTKPYEGMLYNNGIPIKKRFYEESEWRFVPHEIYQTTQYYFHTIDHPNLAPLEELHSKTKQYAIPFAIEDIRYIFVENETHSRELIEFIRKIHHEVSEAEVYSLVSRVVTLDSLRKDL